MTTLRELLADLVARGRLTDEGVGRIAAHLAAESEEPPWYLVLLTGLGAWVATLFFLVGLAMLFDWGKGWEHWMVAAAVLLILGIGARRLSSHLFVAQLSLGLCLAGWAAACVAGAELFDSFGGSAGTGAVVAAVVYLLHPDAGMRFLVSGAAATLLSGWWVVEMENLPLLGRNLPVSVLALGAGVLLLRPGTARAWMPLGHALAVVAATAIPLLDVDWWGSGRPVDWWPSVVVLTLALAALAVHALQPADAEARREALPLCLAAVGLLGAACWVGGPGLLVAVGLLVLGHATARRAVEILGLVALPVFLFLYYRDLDLSLMAKALSLVASGLVLLGLRRALASRPWAREAS